MAVPVKVQVAMRGHAAGETRGAPGSWDPKARTLEITLATDTPYLRKTWSGSYYETLSMEPGACDMSRLMSGAPALLQHAGYDANALLGAFGEPRIEGSRLLATVHFTDEDLAIERGVEAYVQEAARGIRKKWSVGYDVIEWRETGMGEDGIPQILVTKWTPLEGSLVLIPADDDCESRSHGGAMATPAQRAMDAATCAARCDAAAAICDAAAAACDAAGNAACAAACRSCAADCRACAAACRNGADPATLAACCKACGVACESCAALCTTACASACVDCCRACVDCCAACASICGDTPEAAICNGCATQCATAQGRCQAMVGDTSMNDGGGMKSRANPSQEAPMTTETTTTATPADLAAAAAAEVETRLAARHAGVLTSIRKLKLDASDERVAAIVADVKQPLDAARAALIDLAAERDDKPAIQSPQRAGITIGTEEIDHVRNGMLSRIFNKQFGTPYEGRGKEFRFHRLFDMGRALMEAQGVRMPEDPISAARMMLQVRDATGALGTSHFPLLVAAAVNKSLIRGYGMPRTLYPSFTARRVVPDLKTQRELHLDSATDLADVNEHGDYEFSTMVEGQETWAIGRKGRMLKITPEVILADDLSALTLAPQKLGEAAARTREKAFFTALTANGNMADGVAMYHANHGNVVAAGAAPSWAQIAAMRALAWLQTDRSGELIEVELDRFIFPSALEATVATLWAPISPVQAAEAIPDELKSAAHYISPRLDATSTTAYYGFANPELYPCFVAGELDGRSGPAISDEYDFDSGCLKVLVEDYFGIGRIEHRFSVRNPGA